MKVFILMSHFGDKLSLTMACIESLVKYDNAFNGIIIGNNNQDLLKPETVTSDKRLFVVNNGKNLGYGGGINYTIPLALSKGATHLFFINNDCTIDRPFLSTLLKFADQKKDAGVVGVSLKYKKENKWIYDIGGRFSEFGKPFHAETDSIVNLNPIPADFAGCVLVKREVIEKIKGFDQSFFLYFEDVDFSLRAKKEGFNTYVVPKAYIYHGLSRTVGPESSKALYHQSRSGVIYSIKYKKLMFLIEHLLITLKRAIKKPKIAKSALLGIFDGFTNKLASSMVS